MTAMILQFVRMGNKKHLATPPNRIRELREAFPMTQVALADRLDTSSQQISRFETGERELTLPWMKRIAKALGVATGDLLNVDEQGLSADERMVITAMREGDERSRRMIIAPAREALSEPTSGPTRPVVANDTAR